MKFNNKDFLLLKSLIEKFIGKKIEVTNYEKVIQERIDNLKKPQNEYESLKFILKQYENTNFDFTDNEKKMIEEHFVNQKFNKIISFLKDKSKIYFTNNLSDALYFERKSKVLKKQLIFYFISFSISLILLILIIIRITI